MADQAQQASAPNQASNGKGRAPDNVGDVSMGEDEDDEDEEEDEDEPEVEDADADADEDGLDEIDTNNIVTTGRRTRGKIIDFAAAARETPVAADDEEEDEDDDYEAPDEEMEG